MSTNALLLMASPARTRLIARFDTSWRICSRNGGLVDDESLHTVRNGVKPAAISTSRTKRVVTICRSQRELSRRATFMSVRIAKRNFRACVAFVARSPVSLVVARTIGENSTLAFGSSCSRPKKNCKIDIELKEKLCAFVKSLRDVRQPHARSCVWSHDPQFRR